MALRSVNNESARQFRNPDCHRILLVEDSMVFRQALTNLLKRPQWNKIEVLASSSLLSSIETVDQDVALIDTVTWASSDESLIGAIKSIGRRVPLLILGRVSFLDSNPGLLWMGVAGFVEQTASARTLHKAIGVIEAGGVWFDRVFFQQLLGTRPDLLRRVDLPATELEVMRLIAQGKTNKEIGSLLGYSERTIKAHVTSLFQKTGVPSRAGLASYAVLHGLMITPLSVSPQGLRS